MRRLLDTDTCIEILRGNPNVVAQAQSLSPADLCVSVISRHELMYGVSRCAKKRRREESDKVLHFLSTIREVPFTRSCADRAAEIRAALAREGRPIGPYDLLIAATALDEACVLVTHNLSEFSRVPGLSCESWNEAGS